MKQHKKIPFWTVLVIGILLVQTTVLAVSAWKPPGDPPPPSPTTYRVYGYVKKAGTSTPISGATVKIYEGTTLYKGQTTTDATGYYTFSWTTSTTVTKVKSVASKPGYYTSSKIGFMLEGRVRLDHYLTPIPPVSPTIYDVQIDTGAPHEVELSWDTTWASDATEFVVECYWSQDSTITIDDLIYSVVQTTSTVTTEFSCLVPPDLVELASDTYWYKIYAENSNANGASDRTYGPTTYVTSGIWEIVDKDCSDVIGFFKQYDFNCPYPVKNICNSGDLETSYEAGLGDYFYASNIPTPTTCDEWGPIWKWTINPESLDSLHLFEVDLCAITSTSFSQGSLIVSLYDDRSSVDGELPIVYIELKDSSTTSSTKLVSIGYYDESLRHHYDPLRAIVDSSWTGTVRIGFDSTDGLWGQLEGYPVENYAHWSGLNPNRNITRITLQWTKPSIGYQPDLRLLGLRMNCLTNEDTNFYISRAQELKSGPDNLYTTRPGPATEVQFFPNSGDGIIKYYFHGQFIGGWNKLVLDVRALYLNDESTPPPINVRVNGLDYEDGQHHVNLDPNPIDPGAPDEAWTYNYLQTWDIYVLDTDNILEIDVRGTGWDTEDIISLRGVWIYFNDGLGFAHPYYPEAIMPSSGELTYYVPLGPQTELDLEWEGSGMAEVLINGFTKLTCSEGYYEAISMGDHSTKTLHEVKIQAPSGSKISVMHLHHFWINVEVDWVEGNYPSAADFNLMEDYYRFSTHGRINFILDEEIPISSYRDWEHLVEVGETDGYFDNRGDRSFVWLIYVPTAGWGGVAFRSAKHEDGWKRWLGTACNYFDAGTAGRTTAVTMHELGHIAHVHEGYPDNPLVGEPCQCIHCVMGPAPPFPTTDRHEYCAFHWNQTWLNIPNAVRDWALEWWLF